MDYRSKTNIERAKKAREKRTKKALLIALCAVLGLVLIISVAIIAKEKSGSGSGTTPVASSDAVPTEGSTPGENSSTPDESGTGSDVPTETEPSTGTDPVASATDEVTGEPPAPGYKSVIYKTDDIRSLGYLLLVNNSTKYEENPALSLRLINIRENRTNYTSPTEPCSFRVINATPKINSFVMTKMNAMFDACYAVTHDGNVYVSGAYRSYEMQQELYEKNPTNASKPGYSDYHTGYAFSLMYFTNPSTGENVDLDHNECAPIREWLLANSYKYGFIRRYPSDKDSITGIKTDRYHFRYVGEPHACYMFKKNLCLEEYLQTVMTYEFSDRHLTFADDSGANYEIYYVPATPNETEVPVPTGCYYTVEGNNYSGFIVTCYLDRPAN